MRQLKLRRTLIRLNQTSDKSNEILKTNNKAKLNDEVHKPINSNMILF